ncbi:MAG TPA: CYTH domain-containing protein [Candidatus Brocadiaceae bacterium]
MDIHLHDKEKTEIEAKFICPDTLCLDDFLGVVNNIGFQYGKQTPCFQTDVYLDTSDYKLLNSDVALRIRKRGENYRGAYKSSQNQQGAIFERKEFEWPLSGDEIKLWNEEKKPVIPTMVLDALNLHGQTLRKVLVIETQRSTAIVSGNDGLKIELSLDEVVFRGHRGQKPYREIEVELLNAAFEQFVKVVNTLQNHFQLQPAIDSKYKKGMMLVGKYSVKTSPTNE